MADSISQKSLNCLLCKLNCTRKNSICCSKCFSWYHHHCVSLSSNFITKSKNSKNSFVCNLCKLKTQCSSCNAKNYPRSYRVICINCENSFCSDCTFRETGNNIKFFMKPDVNFYCKKCRNCIFHVLSVENHVRI